jgi:catechol 2,3-dioxygenase-like lactoylglutathione lyase family enzyme
LVAGLTTESATKGKRIMKRLHLHIGVENLSEGINFYTALFGTPPVKTKQDYAKWLLDDPRVNFAISTRAKKGVDHLGIQVEEDRELAEVRERLRAKEVTLTSEGETVCCYARSEKSWIQDPSGIAWETYRTMEDVRLFAGETESTEGACCRPDTMGTPDCCEPSEHTAGCCD